MIQPGRFSMKVKRFFANLILLVIFSAAVFFIGWISFYVKPGKCAVLTTKTGGLYPEPIKYGEFLWRWERLLPTNVNISLYDMKEHSYVQTVSGTLPSAEIYRMLLDPKPDFSYSFTVRTVFSVSPEKIHSLVKKGEIENKEESLEEYLRTKSVLAADLVSAYMIGGGQGDQIPASSVLSKNQVEKALSPRLGEFEGISVDSVELVSSKVPDINLYNLAKETYSAYLANLNEVIKEKVKDQADEILQLENSMKQLEQFAGMLEKYPKFNDFSKSGNLSDVMEKLMGAYAGKKSD